ncbi:hypothetical protein FS749_012499 [Ceratobasidium sp. UAMH 11750]|nr:hypothetical protein FS749_012499 [Ceratobasidium sp. UAMH 11750]
MARTWRTLKIYLPREVVLPAALDVTKRNKKGKGKRGANDNASKRKRGKAQSPGPSSEEHENSLREQKRRRIQTRNPSTGAPPVAPAMRECLKAAFTACHPAIQDLLAKDERQRCELFQELPDRRLYPDYYELIQEPIAMFQMRKRMSSGYYKMVSASGDDWRLMFNNGCAYNAASTVQATTESSL